MVNLYEMLGVAIDATENEIRQRIVLHHSAGTLDEKVLEAAKKWLLNADIRKQYDAKLLGNIKPYQQSSGIDMKAPFSGEGKEESRSEFLNKLREEQAHSSKKAYIVAALVVALVALGAASYMYNENKKEKASVLLRENAIKDLKHTVSKRFYDPDSVKYRDVKFGVEDGRAVIACGEYNGKNRFGAYVGFEKFYAELAKDGSRSKGVVDEYNDDGYSETLADNLEKCSEYLASKKGFIIDEIK